VREVLERLPIALLQFHGTEPAEFCRQFARPYIKAVRMREGLDLHTEPRRYPDSAGLLVDSYIPGTPGGTGQVFDWSRIPQDLAGSLILAGGLDPDNVVPAIRQVHPYAVDVSGGVERSKGIKDADKMAAFFRGVARGNNT
jgi:phosphoribosylanthranilate isomerase